MYTLEVCGWAHQPGLRCDDTVQEFVSRAALTLESGEAGTVGLDALLRVSKSRGLSRFEEQQFLESARPDLAFLLNGRGSPAAARRWRSPRKVAVRLRQATDDQDALRTAVEILGAALGPEASAFAVERRPGQTPRVTFVIGRRSELAHLPRAIFAVRAASAGSEISQGTVGDRQIAYAALFRDRSTYGGIGLACVRGGMHPESLAFLRLVGALLEHRVAG